MDHGEEVFASEPAPHRRRVGAGDGGIVPGHEERAERRILHGQQRLAEPRVVDRARLRGSRRLADRRGVEAEGGRGHEERAPARFVVGPDHAGEEGDGADGLAALVRARHALAQANERRARLAVEMGKPHEIGRGDAGDGRHPLGREAREHLALDLVEAERLPGEVVAVGEPVPREHVHEAEGQGGVRPHLDAQIPVGPLGRRAPARLDDDELRPAASRALDEGPDVDVRRHEVGAPRDDEIRLLDGLRIGSAHAAAGGVPARLGARIAHGAREEPRGAEGVEEPQHEPAVDLPLVRAVAIAEDAQRPLVLDDGLPARDDLVEGLLPRDGREATLALGPGATQRGEDAIGGNEHLVLAVDLGAGEARREGMLGVALDLHHAVPVHLREQRALIRAVVRAHRADRLHGFATLIIHGARELWQIGERRATSVSGEVPSTGATCYRERRARGRPRFGGKR